MKQFNLLELVKMLVGHIDFYGETNYDNISLENLENVKLILTEYLDKLCDLVKYYKNDYRYSGKALGEKAFKILLEIRDDLECLDDYLEVRGKNERIN